MRPSEATLLPPVEGLVPDADPTLRSLRPSDDDAWPAPDTTRSLPDALFDAAAAKAAPSTVDPLALFVIKAR